MLQRLQSRAQQQDQQAGGLTTGDAAWLAALQHSVAGVQQTNGAAGVPHEPVAGQSQAGLMLAQGASVMTMTGQASQAGGVMINAADGAAAAVNTSMAGASGGGQNPALSATETMFSQLFLARQNNSPAEPDLTAGASAPGLSVLPLGFSAQNMALQAAPLSVPTPLMLQQPDGTPQLGQNIQWMVGQHISRAQLLVHPAHLGPLQISIDQKNDQTNIQITTMHPMARDLLDQQLPRLREWLNESGLSNVQIMLSMGQSDQQSAGQSAGQSGGQSAFEAASSARGLSAVNTESAPADVSVQGGRITRLGVDTFV